MVLPLVGRKKMSNFHVFLMDFTAVFISQARDGQDANTTQEGSNAVGMVSVCRGVADIGGGGNTGFWEGLTD